MDLRELRRSLSSPPWLLGGILLVALALRLYGLDWDQGQLFHPDERAILMKVGELRFPSSFGEFLSPDSPLNPGWFSYGSFPLYLLKLASSAVSFIDIHLVGRVLSALFDVGTVALVYLLGARLYTRKVGLLAAALTAVTVLHVQLSHFYTSDVLLTTFAVATVFFLARGLEKRDGLSPLLAGVALGLALASKASAVALFAPVAAAFVLQATSATGQPLGPRLRYALGSLLITSAVAGLTAAIAQPYALLDWPTYLADTLRESQMVRRDIDLPYTRQYIGTLAYLYPIQQLAVWGMGLPLGLAAGGGLAYSLWRGIARRQRGDLLLLAWVVPYFAIVGGFEVKFLRYMLPLVPFINIMAARGLLAARERVGWWRPHRRRWATAAVAVVLAISALYALAYVNMYRQPHPAVRLARWAQANLPPGSRIVQEHWEEGLRPLGVRLRTGPQLELYNEDTPGKLDHIVKRLEGADYLALYSNRLYGTIPRLPERYPMTTRYYQLLFSGELGFRLLRAEASYPHLLGVNLADDTFTRPGLPEPEGLSRFLPGGVSLNLGYADESFTVYDHPKAMLFEKTPDFDAARVRSQLAGALVTPRETRKQGLLLSPRDAGAQQAGGTWSEIFPRDSLSQRFPTLAWLLLITALPLTTLPLAWRLFRPLADRGYLLNKALALLLLSFLPWWLASLHWLPFTRASIGLGWGVLAVASAAVGWRQRWRLWAFLKEHWRLLAFEEALFLAAFLGFLALRLANPDLWHMWRGGEKPMDFAYLIAVIRSSYMPPYDPWFAGGYLNYYYLGQFLAAVPIKLIGIRPEVAYNLVVPLFFALTVGAAFSVVYNLVRASRGRARSALLVGVAGAALVAVLGNLDGGLQVGEGLLARLAGATGPPFDFWRSSRMLPPSFAITEFPFFTFLFADLHAHLLALPFTLLAIGLTVAVALDRGPPGWAGLRHQAPRLLALGLVLGALLGINSWDFPTYLLLAGVGLAIAEHAGRGRLAAATLGWTALKLGGLYALSILLFLPFHQSYELFYAGVSPSPERTPLYQYVFIYGLFLFLALSFLAGELRRFPVPRQWGPPGRAMALGGAAAVALALILLGWSTVGFLVLVGTGVAVLILARLGSPYGWHRPRVVVLALIGLAAALGIGVDLVTMEGDIVRMNTVFKFYLQGWVLWSLAAAYSLWWVGRRVGHWPRLGRVVWLGGLAVLLAAAAIYPVAGTRARLADRFQVLPLTLDGMAYMRSATYQDKGGPIELVWDYQAIRWLRDNLRGTPVIVEGITPLYRWGSRVSVYTGLPTVIGWDWHQRQQRWGYQWMVQARLQDVNRLYTTPDPALAGSILAKYGVRYVYIGPVERLYYPDVGLAKFEGMAGLEVVYSNPQVKIYRVTG